MDKSISVLHIITGGLQREGISSTQLEFFRHMDLERFVITVAAVHNNSAEIMREYEKFGCAVVEFPDRQTKLVSYFIALARYLKKSKPDIVHVHGSSAIMSVELLAAWLSGIHVRIAHSRNTRASQVKLDKLLRPLFRLLYTNGLACGVDAGKWLFGDASFTVIHNGKDFGKFCFDSELREKKRTEFGIQNKTVIGHVGVFNFQKNHRYLLSVFDEYQKRNHDAVLYLMGTGSLLEDVKDEVEQLGIADKVIFAGSVSDVADRLQTMDMMVFPSRFEGLPNVVLEWQAEGLPCLISDKITTECAPSDLVGFASIEDSPKVWADEMERIFAKFSDREAQAKRGTQALKRNGFDIEDAAKQLEAYYCGLMQDQ